MPGLTRHPPGGVTASAMLRLCVAVGGICRMVVFAIERAANAAYVHPEPRFMRLRILIQHRPCRA